MTFLDHWRRQDYVALREMRGSIEHRPPVASWTWSKTSVLFLSRKWHLAGSEIYAHRWGQNLKLRGYDVTFTTPRVALSWSPEHLWSYGAIVCVHGASAEMANKLFHFGAYGPRIVGMVNTTSSSLDPIRLADLVIANTEAEAHFEQAVGSVVVLHPPLGDFKITRSDTQALGLASSGYVTQVNLDKKHKNPKVFTHLAHSFPTHSFLAVLGAYGEQDVPDLPNVTTLPNGARSVQQALARTKLLLQPSTKESYGMTIAEAVSAGVPVVCSDLPGPHEAAGEHAAIYVGDPDDLEAWKRAFVLALTYYGRMLADCQERAFQLARREGAELEHAFKALRAVIETRQA